MTVHAKLEEIRDLDYDRALDAPTAIIETASPSVFDLINDVEAERLPDVRWGMENTYPHGGLVLFYGPRGSGKSFAALGWAFSHGTGMPWLDRAVLRGPVVYVMAEGRGGIGPRVRAQKRHLGIEGPAGVHFLTAAVPLLNTREVGRLIATCETLSDPPVALVFDTLSRSFAGGDENTAKDMANFVTHLYRIGEALGGPTRIVIHHSGHGSTERERGSSVLGGASDTIIALRPRDGLLELGCDKQRDAPEFDPLLVEILPVEGTNSCVISLHEERGVTDPALSRIERQALRSLHEGFLADGASVTAWLKASGMPDSSFYKARTSLVRREIVEQKGTGRGSRYAATPRGRALLSLHAPPKTP